MSFRRPRLQFYRPQRGLSEIYRLALMRQVGAAELLMTIHPGGGAKPKPRSAGKETAELSKLEEETRRDGFVAVRVARHVNHHVSEVYSLPRIT